MNKPEHAISFATAAPLEGQDLDYYVDFFFKKSEIQSTVYSDSLKPQCSAGRKRSIEDVFAFCMDKCDCDAESVTRSVLALCEKEEIFGYYCGGVQRYVFNTGSNWLRNVGNRHRGVNRCVGGVTEYSLAELFSRFEKNSSLFSQAKAALRYLTYFAEVMNDKNYIPNGLPDEI